MIRVVTAAILLASPALAVAGQDVSLSVLSAVVKDKTIEGAEVILQKNGATSLKGVTDAKGQVKFSAPFGGSDDDSVTLIVKKAGHSNLVAKCPCNGMSYALSPVMRELDGMRIVLSWGERPADLDSHLLFQDKHISFLAMKAAGKAHLDVDDTTSYGPETITIDSKETGVRYAYAVQSYSNLGETRSRDLVSLSRATVNVYVGSSLVRTFRPPAQPFGNLWVVFAVGENGEFYDINHVTDVQDEGYVKDVLKKYTGTSDLKSVVSSDSSGLQEADRLNREGEKAYHAGQLEDAVSLYNDAINLNPEHSQAYSNLGLAYQKLKRDAEAIWANRKAIALASGPKAGTVKASSYFNIARVYESQEKWEEALDSFERAKENKANPTYDKGVVRMKEKLGRK